MQLNPEVPPELGRIISKALEKNRDLRCQTAAELRADLKRLKRDLESAQSAAKASAVAEAVAPEKAQARARDERKKANMAMLALAASVILIGSLALVLRQKPQKSSEIATSKYVPLTDFNDSAVAPALSPDGRMLAFVRHGGFGDSFSYEGQIYVKVLPNGEPAQLTTDALGKYAPAFTPDGTRIVYTAVDKAFVWDSWQVPVLGGSPRLFMVNASGLNWVADKALLYSEIKQGVHMGIVSSDENRIGHRDVYLPPGDSSMAHRSALSPDHKFVLVVEMDGTGWLPCRLVPFDGSSPGVPVGPQQGQCTTAAWSPDGRWMYFSSNASGGYHLWRKAFPDGSAEQITFGPTEEEGTAVTPDGEYLITSVGVKQASIWLRDSAGDRQLTSQGFALLPVLSPEEEKIYYLIGSGTSRAYVSAELWSLDLHTGEKEPALPGYHMGHFRISRDGRRVLFTSTGEQQAGDGIWIANLDRRTPPRQLTHGGEFRAFFGAPGEILYLSGGEDRHLYRMKEDGSEQQMVMPDTITYLIGVSSDGNWAAVTLPQTPGTSGTTAEFFPVHGGRPFVACNTCVPGFGPGRQQAPMFEWSADGKYLYVSLQWFGFHPQKTVVLPYWNQQEFENRWPRGLKSEKDLAALPGARVIAEANVFPGVDPSKYLFWKLTTQSNLYRIPLRD